LTVRAAVLHETGKPLEIEEIDLVPTAPGCVRVAIAASGVCHSDLSIVNGTLPHPTPVVIGHEGAGVVTEVGDGVTRVKPGDHVILNWTPACGQCAFCRRGEVYLCAKSAGMSWRAPYGTLRGGELLRGFGTGTFATDTHVLERGVVPIDNAVPLEIAALVGCAVTTGVGAVLNTAKVTPGATVAVVGCGGVGLSVVMGANYADASRIIAIDFSAERRALAQTLGATDIVDGADDVAAIVKELTDGEGVDYAFEVVGRPATVTLAYTIARRGGTVVAIGAGSREDSVSISSFDLFYSAKTIHGCVYGSANPDLDFPRFLGLWREGALPVDALVTDHISLEGINDAFAAMEAGSGARTVIVN
jgi:S-(hydroxymethyl)glutathione dehydrogenase/alcohol dehydrogenase